MLYSRGQLAIAERPASGARYLASALAAFEQLGHGHGTALALAGLAYVDRLDGHYELALSRYATSRDLFRQAGDRVSEVDCMTSMAQIHADREEFEAARGLLVEALTACQTLAAPRIIAQTDYRMGSFLLSTGDLTQAERHLRLSLQVVRDEGDTIGEVYALHALATVHAVQRRHSISNAEFRAALDLSRQVGEKLVHGRVLLAYAEALEARPERDYAAALAGEALAVFGEVGGPLVLCAQAHALQARLSGPDWAAGGAAEGPHAAPSRPHGGPAWPCDAGEAW
jgi:tetratricopeptide (TPR) repeat protein